MKFTALLALGSLVAGANALQPIGGLDSAPHADFALWREHYAVGEEASLETFAKHRAVVIAHNAKYAAGESSFSLELNEFAATENDVFRAQRNTLRRGQSPASAATRTFEAGNSSTAPAAWDWRDTANVVNPVKNQGSCGSCWAFSAVATMEGALNLKQGKLNSLSEQELVDCCNGGANTCSVGGQMYQGVEYGISSGMMSEADYPYQGTSGHKCAFDASKDVHKFSGYVNVTSGDENALMQAAFAQPIVSVGIDASSIWFQLYFGGVMDIKSCSSTNLDHGVAVVGYGVDASSKKDFWWVRNSWGSFWGIKGYVKMSRNANNQCGIATQACFAHV